MYLVPRPIRILARTFALTVSIIVTETDTLDTDC